MNRYGYCKAKDKDTGKWIEGYYACLPYTTYCLSEDYKANPNNDKEYVIGTEMMDWGLPNKVTITEIVPNSAKRYIGTDKHGRKVFEDDIVRFIFKAQGGEFPVNVQMYYGDWCVQFRKLDFGMWCEERQLWLEDSELVLEEENEGSNG